MVARYVTLSFIMLSAFGGLVAGEEEKHNEPIAQSNLSMDINSAVEAIKGKDVKKAAEHMASIAVELKQVGGALEDKTLLDIEKLAAVGLNSEEEFRQAVVTMCMSSGDKVKGCMLDVLRKQALVAIVRQREPGNLDGPMVNQLRKAFTTVARRNDATLLLAELDLMSRYRIELSSILADQIALSKVDTDVLYGIEREVIMSMRRTGENLRFACIGLIELAERNADGVLMLIVEAEKSERFIVPKGGGKRVYMLKEAAKTARLRMAERMKQTNAIPQLREIVDKN